ncbi:MAG: MFS transporter [Phycisphaerae bacterium]|nr:MFS transporter [Gemmatimonadaceae bacterium]
MTSAGSGISSQPHTALSRQLNRVVNIRPEEVRAALMACLYFFFLLTSYFILRSIRDSVGVQAGISRLPSLFMYTFFATLLLNPVFSLVVSKLPVRRFIPIVYRVFCLCLLAFAAIIHFVPAERTGWMIPVFWTWAAVFSLFVPSVFWGFMSDTFTSEQSKRLYGFVGVGGTLGALAGSAITALLVKHIGIPALLLLSAVMLETGVQVVRHFPASFRRETRDREAARAPIGGNSFAGFTHVLQSPYLLMICGYMMLYTIGTTVLYMQQAQIVKEAFATQEAQASFLAYVDLSVQILTILAQIFITGRVIKWLGVGVTLAILPLMSIIGFTALWLAPSIGLFVAFSTLRRAGNNAFASPGREVLYTVVTPEDKYKAKNLIDTFVYRSGDQIGSSSYAALAAAGFAAASISLLAAPMSLMWLGIAFWLGRRHGWMTANEDRISIMPKPAAVPARP